MTCVFNLLSSWFTLMLQYSSKHKITKCSQSTCNSSLFIKPDFYQCR